MGKKKKRYKQKDHVTHVKKEKKSEEDVTIDLSGIRTILNKDMISTAAKFLPILLIIIPIIMSVSIRTQPAELQIANNWARQSIYSNVQNNIAAQINQQFPNLPDQTRQQRVNEQFNQVLIQQFQQIEQAVLANAEQIRERFRDEQGNTYLGDIDSYFWARYARNIVEKGHYGDEIIDGVQYDNHMQAPSGFSILKPNFYPYFEAYLHRILSIFNPNQSIMVSAFYAPMFLSFFAIIAAFFIGKKLSGNLTGFLAAMLIAVNPTVLSRSLGSDNDIVNAVFPLIIMLFTIYAIDAKDKKSIIIFTLLSGFFIGFYSIAWSGWWFMFLLIVGAALVYIGYLIIFEFFNNRKNFLKNPIKIISDTRMQNTFTFLLIFLIGCFLFLTLFGNGREFLASFLYPLDIVTIKEASRGASLWPNVYTTVAELNAANIPQIIQSIGGRTFLLVALLGTIVTLANFGSESKKITIINTLYFIFSIFFYLILIQAGVNMDLILLLALLSVPLILGLMLSAVFGYSIDTRHSILMVMWFMATIYASTRGVRFILLIVPAFVISFSTFIGVITDNISRFINRALDINYNISKIILVVVSLLVLIQPINIGYATAFNYVPSISDAWVSSLEKIRAESQPDAIINSWWDFGHWFKFWADRRVTFDGASQNSAKAHWIGKVLLTDDEDQAVAILRMLDCGGIDSVTQLTELTKDTYATVNMIYRFFEMKPDDVRNELRDITTDEHADEILSYLFCEPPENYFITSGDMVGKSGVWAHFGSWNFERAKLYNYYNTLSSQDFTSTVMAELNYDSETAQNRYNELSNLRTDRQANDWIAPWPSYGGIVGCSALNNETVQCNVPAQNNQIIPLQINLTDNDPFVNSPNGLFRPNTFGYFEEDEFKIKEFSGDTIGWGVTMIDNNRILFMAPELTGSMFTRMFYLDGRGLKHFDKFHDATSVGNTRIITWTVDWPNEE